MDRRTRDYLKGRFGDYYRSVSLTHPPAADDREWGYIPWTAGGTTMVRHQSLLEVGDLGHFLVEESPRHVYFSAAHWRDPGAPTMDEKGWLGADLVFDLDADHLPGVDPETTSYPDMLAACKDALLDLLDLLRDDFAFEELQVVFSGGRGYHVHVRDESVFGLGSDARREVVDYVRANDFDVDTLVETRARGTTTRRELRTEGGWGLRVHRRLVDFVDELRGMDEENARERLMAYDGIGEGRAETILGTVHNNPDALRAGNVEAGGPGVRTLVRALAKETLEAETAPIDEPVTTDTRRLIRFPGSLHGGSGLVVTPLEESEIETFDPLSDAIPERFTDHEVRVEVTDGGEVTFDGDTFTLSAGEHVVRESLGVFLLCRGRAEKVRE